MPAPDPSSAPAGTGQPSPSNFTSHPVMFIVYCTTIVVAAVVGLTLVTVFHYKTSTEAASVLGVVVPVFTAVVGVAVGGGAGAAAGAARARAAHKESATAHQKLAAAKKVAEQLNGRYRQHSERLSTALASAAESPFLTAVVNGESRTVADSTQMAEISRQLGHLEGLLE